MVEQTKYNLGYEHDMKGISAGEFVVLSTRNIDRVPLCISARKGPLHEILERNALPGEILRIGTGRRTVRGAQSLFKVAGTCVIRSVKWFWKSLSI